MNINIAFDEALQLLLDKCSITSKEKVNLGDSLGRVLAEDIIAEEDIPKFKRSPLDGYAFRAQDTINANYDNPVTLEVIEEVSAGYVTKNKVTSGKAIKVMTGAAIPEGADAVVRYEKAKEEGHLVKIFSSFKSGQNIVPVGDDVVKSQIIAYKGQVVNAPLLGLFAALGITEVWVHRKPKVAVISTGNELQDISEIPEPGKIRNSNKYTLEAYIKELGGIPVILGTAKDRVEDVASLVAKGLEKADMVITTGGVSVGDYDIVKDAVKSIGADIVFWRIDMKPGAPTLFSVKDGKVILGLSGNPAAAMVVFQLLGTSFIKKLGGRTDYLHTKIVVTLKDDYNKTSPRMRFIRGRLLIDNGLAWMVLTGGQSNNVLSSFVQCNLLAKIPAGSGVIKAGEKLEAYLLN